MNLAASRPANEWFRRSAGLGARFSCPGNNSSPRRRGILPGVPSSSQLSLQMIRYSSSGMAVLACQRLSAAKSSTHPLSRTNSPRIISKAGPAAGRPPRPLSSAVRLSANHSFSHRFDRAAPFRYPPIRNSRYLRRCFEKSPSPPSHGSRSQLSAISARPRRVKASRPPRPTSSRPERQRRPAAMR